MGMRWETAFVERCRAGRRCLACHVLSNLSNIRHYCSARPAAAVGDYHQVRDSRGSVDMDEEKLILEVENFMILYDTTHPFYEDTDSKEKAWAEIAEVLGVPVDVCKARWKGLRDAFVQSRKKSNLPSGSSGGGQKERKYEEIMSFLLPHIQPRCSESNLAAVVQMETEGERSVTPLSFSGPECSTAPNPRMTMAASPTPSLSLPSTPQQRERCSRSGSPMGLKTSREPTHKTGKDTRRSQRPPTAAIILQEPAPKPHIPDNELEESYHFALSLVPMLLRLEKDKRQEAKIIILQTLHNLEQTQHQQLSAPHPHSTHVKH